MAACHKCGGALKGETDFGRQDVCPGCLSATRACLNCVHYEPSRYNECTEPVAERVVDKEKATFCDYFKPTDREPGARASRGTDALKAAEALFKKKG